MYVYTIKPDVLADRGEVSSPCHTAETVRESLTLVGASSTLIENLLAEDEVISDATWSAITERIAREHGIHVRRHREIALHA